MNRSVYLEKIFRFLNTSQFKKLKIQRTLLNENT